MNFLKIANKDISSIFKNRVIRVSVIAIIIVPLLYSLLYLAAFWDPYSKLDQLPVAFVNLDEGTTVDGEQVIYGNDIVDELKGNKEVQWHFVSLEEAKKGLKKDGYYSMFVIPKDFSEKITSAKTGVPTKPTIVYTANEKKNFLAAQIGGRVEDQIIKEVNQSIISEYTKVTFDQFELVKDGMIEASDGSQLLADGLIQLNENTPALSEGVRQLVDGASQINNGVNSKTLDAFGNPTGLYAASNAIYHGMVEFNGKIPSLTQGVNVLNTGANQLNVGLNTTSVDQNGNPLGLINGMEAFQTGLNQVSGGVDQLGNALNSLNSAVNVGTPTSPSLVTGVSGINDGVNALGGALQAMNGVVNGATVLPSTGMTQQQLVQALTQQYQAATTDAERVAILSKMVYVLNQAVNVDQSATSPSLKTAMNGLTASVTVDTPTHVSLKSAVAGINAAVNTSTPTKPSLKDGMNQLVTSNGKLVDGAKQIGDGMNQLTTGMNTLNDSLPALTDGANQLMEGSKKLNTGIGSLGAGTTQLLDGLNQLNSKIPALTTGTNQLTDGSKELSTALTDGATELKNNLVNTSEDMANFISNPVEIKNEAIHAVKDYGTGFTPYFIPLSLWVGAIMMFFVISSKVSDDIKAGPISTVLGKFLSYGFIGTLQAILVSIVVLFLGLKPEHLTLYFLFNILMSLTFIAIIQALIFILGDIGRLLAIVLLILQLTSDAGTFPLELVPNFFKVINPYMPFTYVVSALREIISGDSLNIIIHDSLILTGMLFVFLFISIGLKEHGELLQKRMEEKKELAI